MKITIEFDNGPALVIAPGQLSLQQSTPEKLTLAVPCGTYAIPVAEFAGSLATAEEVAERNAVAAQEFADSVVRVRANGDGKLVVAPELGNEGLPLCLEPTARYSCSLAKGHGGCFHAAYENHELTGTLIGTKPAVPLPY